MNMAVLERWIRRTLLGAGLCWSLIPVWASPTVQTFYGPFSLGETTPLQKEIPRQAPALGRPLSLPPLPNVSRLTREPIQVSFFDRVGRSFQSGLEEYQQEKFEIVLRRFRSIIQNEPQGRWATPSLFWLGQARAQLGQHQEAERELQEWLRLDQERQTGFRTAAYLSLTWLTARRQACLESQVWLDRVRTLGQPSRENLREATRIELYCAAQIDPMQVPAIFEQLRQSEMSALNLVRFAAEEAAYHYEQGVCLPIFHLREEYFEKYYNYAEMEEITVMSAWCYWQAKDWDGLRREVEALLKRGVRNEDQLTLLQLELALQDQQAPKIRQVLQTLRMRELRREGAYRVMWQAAEWGWWDFLLDFPLSPEEFVLRSRREEFQLLQALAHEQTQRPDAARSSYLALVESRELSAELKGEALYRLARLELLAQRPEAALESCNRLIQEFVESPHLEECYFWQAALEDPRRKNQRRAIGLSLRQVSPEIGREEEKTLIRMRLSMLEEEWLEAQREAQSLVDQQPPSRYQRAAWRALIEIFARLELPEEALQQLQALLQAHPEEFDKPLLVQQVGLLRQRERKEEALQALLRHPELLDLELEQLQLDLLWDLQLWEGFLEKALVLLPQLSDPGETAQLNFRRGQAYEQLRDPLKAIPAYERSLEKVLRPPWEAEAGLAILRIRYELQDARFAEEAENFLKDTRFAPEQEEQVRNWLIERYESSGEAAKSIPHRQRRIALWEDRLRNNLDSTPVDREQRMLQIGQEYAQLGRLQDDRRAWEQAESWSVQLRRSEALEMQKSGLMLGGEAAAALESHERSVAAYLQLTYLYGENLEVEEKGKIWLQMGLSYEALGRQSDARAIYQKIKNELQDSKMQQAADAALKRLDPQS